MNSFRVFEWKGGGIGIRTLKVAEAKIKYSVAKRFDLVRSRVCQRALEIAGSSPVPSTKHPCAPGGRG
mgnify:CR=1 FL=1